MCIHLWQAPRQNSILNEWTIHFCQWVWLCAINSERQQNFPVLHVRCSTTSNQASRRLFYQQSDGVIREKHWVIMLDWSCKHVQYPAYIEYMCHLCHTADFTCTGRDIKTSQNSINRICQKSKKETFFFFREQFTLKLAYMYNTWNLLS